ncbi:hypothetical protein BASA81_017024 [Batrachochytrium salamandrivorans]|nr:hypothetical protein BASA81_017024 [Batrachochytrium salamandrivorans]
MKLQGVFMIIPLLAVTVSGSTTPSQTGYSVQRLEKRGDSDPASKGSTPKNTKVKSAVGSESQRNALSKALGKHLLLAEQLDKADKKWNQDQDGSQNRMGSYEKEKIVESSNLGKKYPTPQHSAGNDDGKEPARRSNIVQIDPKVQRFVTREKDKIMNSIGSFKATRRLRDSMRKDRSVGSSNSLPEHYRNQRKIGNNWLDSSAGPSSYWDQYDTDQHSVDDTMSGSMDKSNQGEMTFRDSSKKKHSEPQAQSSVWPKGMSRGKAAGTSHALGSLGSSRGRSHSTSTGPKQIENDYQKMCEQVTGHRIQSGLLPAIQKSRLRLLGRALDPGVENVYTWLHGGVLNDEADLDQCWLDGAVEHESMGTRHDNRALAETVG